MAAKLPIDFEEKVKQPPPPGGNGYPYQISAKDLMKNYKYLLNRVPSGDNDNDMLVWNFGSWILLPAPANTGTFVLGVVDGEMQWMSTEECA